MHRLEDVVKNLKEERDSRSQQSLYGAESSVGKGVNKGQGGKGAGVKDGKAPAKRQKEQQNSHGKSKPQRQQQEQHQPQQLQQEQSSSDPQSVPNGDANGHVADVDSAVAQSVAEKLVL